MALRLPWLRCLRPGSPAKAQAPQAGNFSLIFFQRIRQWFDAQAAGIVAYTEHAVRFHVVIHHYRTIRLPSSSCAAASTVPVRRQLSPIFSSRSSPASGTRLAVPDSVHSARLLAPRNFALATISWPV